MARYEANSPQQKRLDGILKNLKKAVKAEEHSRREALEDLKFLNGDQWDQAERRRRSQANRPALQIPLLQPYVDQVVGEGRHNRPRCKVRPADSGADINIANIREGIIADIEYSSNAEAIYDQALEMAVSCGHGAWIIRTRYTEDNPFVQECYLEYIENPFLAYLQPGVSDPAGMGAKWGFLLSRMTKEDFEDEYPAAKYTQEAFKTGQGLQDEHFFEEGLITIAEYYEVIESDVKMHLLADGRVVSDDDYKDFVKSWKDKSEQLQSGQAFEGLGQQGPAQLSMPSGNPPHNPAGANPLPSGKSPAPGPIQGPPSGNPPPNPGGNPGGNPALNPQIMLSVAKAKAMAESAEKEPRIVDTKTAKVRKVKQYLLTPYEFLNEHEEKGEDFPGKHIPIIQVRGKQINIEGKRHVKGLIRAAKDPQKLYNYWETAGAEIIALAPKAPWVGTDKMFAGHENMFAAANVENFPYLTFNIDPESPQMMPQRQGMPQVPTAIFAQTERAKQNIQYAIGMFDHDLGDHGSEQTGQAVINKQRATGISTFVFQDNLARAIKLSGIVLNDMLPEVYDTERDVRVRGKDGTEAFVPINTTLDKAIKKVKENAQRYGGMDLPSMEAQKNEYSGRWVKFNYLGSGRYDIVVTTGPSYATQRQESAQMMLQLFQAAPQQLGLALDLIVKNMDFKDADEVARRLERGLPQGMVKPRPGEKPPEPLPPPPQVQLMQAKVQIEQLKGQMLQEKGKQEQIKLQHEMIKMKIEEVRLQLAIIEAKKGETPEDDSIERATAMSQHLESEKRLQLEAAKLNLEMKKLEHQMQKDLHQQELSSKEHDLKRDQHIHKMVDDDEKNEIARMAAKNKPKGASKK